MLSLTPAPSAAQQGSTYQCGRTSEDRPSRSALGIDVGIILREELQPAPHARAATAIDVAELALEIGFLTGDYTVADDECEGHQRQQ
jgi:hypothetical protein